MRKKITANDFHDAIERQLSGLEPDPRLAQRIIASDKEEVKVKKVSGATLMIAAVIILAMATAIAAGLGGRVNWLGEVQPESEATIIPTPMPLESEATIVPTPMPTVEPQAVGEPEEMDPRFYELLDYSKDRELIVLSTAHGGTWSGRFQKLCSMQDFRTCMETAAPDFPLPAEIPEGYVFDRCTVEYGCLPHGKYILTSQTVHPEGFTENHYTVDPSMDFVKAYSLMFKTQDEKGHISVHVFMHCPADPREYAFGITEEQSARAVQAAGMENAIIVESENTSLLAMRKIMSSPQDDLQFTGPEMEPLTETYTEYRIEVRTERMPEDELLRMFAE